MRIPQRLIAVGPVLVLHIALAGCGEDVIALDAAEQDTGTELEPCSGAYGSTWYVRPDGAGPPECNGLTDAPHLDSGESQDCAFSHPFHALPPGGESPLEPGDRLIIAPGEYQMGIYAPGTEGSEVCDPDFPWACASTAVPSGEDEGQPTCVLGAGWDEECAEPEVTLFAHGGASHVLSLEHSDNIRVECLRITDLSDCIAGHPWLDCPEALELPESSVGETGIVAGPSANVTLKNVHVQGMSMDGIRGMEGLVDWTLEDVYVQYNGHNGIRFDSDGEQWLVTWGDFNLTRVESSWNGCNEPPEDLDLPFTCWGSDGYGLNADISAAEWSIEASDFSHNTGTGLRIVRNEPEGFTGIDRLRAEGNAWMQIDVSGDAEITNSLLIGNCDFFQLVEPPYEEPFGCLEEAPAAQLRLFDGSTVGLINSTVYGRGAALLSTLPGELDDDLCEETTFVGLNSIFYGAEVDTQPSLLEDFDCGFSIVEIGYSMIYGLDPECEELHEIWGNDCEAPGFGEPDPAAIDLYLALEPALDSAAVDTGLSPDEEDLIPDHDYWGQPRPMGAGVDRGAFEVLQ